MKICHLTSVHSALDYRIFYKECKTLEKNGYEVHIVGNADVNERVQGISIHRLETSGASRIKRMTFKIIELYHKAMSIDAEIYHFHDPELIPMGLLLKMKGKKVIYDTHEDTTSGIKTKMWLNKIFRVPVALTFYWFEQIAVYFFDLVISGHPKASKNIKSALPLYNYPDLELLPDLNQEESNGKFLWFGLFSEGRGASVIKSAIKKNKGLKLDVIGKVYDIKWIEDRMHFLGNYPVDQAFEMARYYHAGLVTYLPAPNNINSSPNKMFDYMALGLPVIASNFSEWRKIIEQHNCGICVDPLNPDDIAKAMEYLLKNKTTARQMGLNGRQLIEKKYNWNCESKKLLTAYSDLAKREK